ncbi:MAG TPA: curli assembly protein CsgF [Aequorivita sp.]|nr:curli assembly protein CsgF [Aequorivita sp.]
MKSKLLIPFLLLLFFGTAGYAQQFSYKPINPAFGGDTFNYQWMLSSATSQNKLTGPTTQREQDSELKKFGDNLNRQLLSQISRSLLQQQLGSMGVLDKEGTFTFGTLNIEIFQGPDGLVINILDTSNGEETQIIVPN